MKLKESSWLKGGRVSEYAVVVVVVVGVERERD